MKYPSGHRYLMGTYIKVLSQEYTMTEIHEKLGNVVMNIVYFTSMRLVINMDKEEGDICEKFSVKNHLGKT